MIPPIMMKWNGEALCPAGAHWIRLANEHYVIGECYRIEPYEDRSSATHNHFFACVAESWRNLPEDLVERFPTPDHLRKWALIKAGFRDERSVVCRSKAEAQRIAVFIQPMNDYAIVTARECVVIVYTAKSQSMRAMGKKEFQISKQAVLGIVSDMIGVTLDELRRQVDVSGQPLDPRM